METGEIAVVTASTDGTFEWLAGGVLLGEGPRFDDDGALYYGDAVGSGLYRMTADGKVEALLPERRGVGGVVVDRSGAIICSGRDGLARWDPRTGASSPVPLMIGGVAIGDVNDIEADPAGNLYGGTIDFGAFERGDKPAPGMVFRLGADGSARKILDMAVPNGMDFSDDGRTFFLSETGAGVCAYDIDADGTVANRRLLAPMPDSDGIAVDATGGFWVARYFGRTIEYHDADGALKHVVETPFTAAASLTFGGADLRDLYVVGGDMKDRANGGVARFRVDTPGRPPSKSALGG